MSAASLTWGGRSIPGPGGLPAVAVSLTGPSLAQARTQARSAVDAGADVLELRVDLLEEAGALAASDPLDAAAAAAQVLECLRGLGEAIDVADGAAGLGPRLGEARPGQGDGHRGQAAGGGDAAPAPGQRRLAHAGAPSAGPGSGTSDRAMPSRMS